VAPREEARGAVAARPCRAVREEGACSALNREREEGASPREEWRR
jgi:hypothetical protein